MVAHQIKCGQLQDLIAAHLTCYSNLQTAGLVNLTFDVWN